jgi:hypothetical protein
MQSRRRRGEGEERERRAGGERVRERRESALKSTGSRRQKRAREPIIMK